MTTIAAYANGSSVWMAADGISIDANYRRWPEPHKIARLPVLTPENGRDGRHAEALVGMGGSIALIALVQHELQMPNAPEDDNTRDLYRWAHHVAERITELAIELKPPITDSDGNIDGQGILGFAGRLWSLTEHSATPLPSAWAIGTGGEFALGALHAHAGTKPDDPETILRAALQAAIAHDAGSGEPIAWQRVDSPYPDSKRSTADDVTMPIPKGVIPKADRIISVPNRVYTPETL